MRDRASGVHPDILEHLPPKKNQSLPTVLLSLVAASRGHSLLRCAVLTLRWLLLLLSTDSRCSGFNGKQMGKQWKQWLTLFFYAPKSLQKHLLQHHNSKASILRLSAFFTLQLSHPYVTTGKTVALTRQTFVGKVMSLLFNMLSRLVIAFLSRSKCLFISWLQSPSAVILQPKKIKSVTVSTVSLSIYHEVMGPEVM